MQFVKDGPDLPERLLQAHEEGRVVFFCGAGISYPAGLPGFGGLVDQLYDELGETPNPVEKAALDSYRYDTAIGLLESRVVGNRLATRTAIARILTPKKRSKDSTATHEALLTLSRNADGRVRLITTNFDHLFAKVIKRHKLEVPHYCAPLLPVPKKRWDGLIYLHGLLPIKITPSELDRLIVSSGDFGLAYLTERWAARFVSELFRTYTVCFVGYSIDDPVLRYMMDALAADRLLGERPPEAYAFGSCKDGEETQADSQWRAKNVTPILYRENTGHTFFHATLRAWADTYRDGVRGQEAIVARYAATRPLGSTKQDDFVGRMIWALSDPSGLPAKSFADFDPLPHLDWLDAFSTTRFSHHDLARFGVTAEHVTDDKLAFSLVGRPSPYALAPWMRLVSPSYAQSGRLDKVMGHLARWLVRHLDDPRVLLWIASNGSQLHENFGYLIAEELGKKPRSAPLSAFWRIILSGRLKDSSSHHHDLFTWRRRLTNEGLTSSLRRQLRDILSPRIRLRKAYRYDEDEPEAEDEIPEIDWELVLASDHVHSVLSDVAKGDAWQKALPDLLTDGTELLLESLEILKELGKADDVSDGSFWQQPSIKQHPQNRTFRDWTALIDLARDAWIATANQQPARAVREVYRWSEIRFPLFQRLVLFALAEKPDLFDTDETLVLLLSREHHWLWSAETQHEVMRLIDVLASRMDEGQSARLEDAILEGPPLKDMQDDVDDDRRVRRTSREIWRRLLLLRNSGATLSSKGAARLNDILSDNPQWKELGEKDEFPIWMSSGDIGRQFQLSPEPRRELQQWLLDNPSPNVFDEADDWRDRCRSDYARCALALSCLATQGHWIIERWKQALQVWSEEQLAKISWRHISPRLIEAPGDVIAGLQQPIGWWLKSCARHVDKNEAVFFNLIRRVMDAASKQSEEQSETSISQALNHPVGYVTDASLTWWYAQGLEDGQGLHAGVQDIFSSLCDREISNFSNGRLLLCTHVITLFRVDAGWTKLHLLPLFDWNLDESEARAAWTGFLWSPRLYWPLIATLKSPFLTAADHYSDFEELGDQYVALLTFAALESNGTISQKEFVQTMLALPTKALERAVLSVAEAIEGAGDRHAEFWENRAKPYFQKIWPKSQNLRTPAISGNFARLIVECGGAFPDALMALRDWLQPTEHADFAIHKLGDDDLCSRFPDDALAFLAAVFIQQPLWSAHEVRTCLNKIVVANPALAGDSRFTRIDTALRAAGR